MDDETLQGNGGRVDKTCPNQDVIIYKKLTDFCHFGQITVNSDIFCQFSFTLDSFLSFCSLSHLDLDMFLSIRPLFLCSESLSKRRQMWSELSERLSGQ